MSGLKGGALLLILGIPVAGYCALQWKEVARADVIAADAPPDRGPPKDRLEAARAKSETMLSDVRKAATVDGQYRAATPDDACAGPAAVAVVKAAAGRAADLNDLDLFLAEVERPNFTGRLKGQYEKWAAERRELKRDEQAVADWLARPPAIASAADAAKAADAINALLAQYATRSKFSDNAKAAAWRVRARLVVADALAQLADAQYRAAVKVKLPLEPGTNAVKTAVDTLRALKAAVAALSADAATAEEEKKLEPNLRAAVDAKAAVAEECAAREELLSLFAKDDLFAAAGGAGPWLREVAAQYRKTKDEKVRALIREKVQEFCDAFIPRAARLDDKVVLKGKEVDRKDVVVKYTTGAGGAVKREPLSGELDGVNEFNLRQKRPGDNTLVVYMGSEEYPRDLKPTELSRAAVAFDAARKRLADGAAEPKWSAKSVAGLKKACEPLKELVDQLQTPGATRVGKEPRLWTRLSGLADGMAGNADLFAAGP